MCGRVRLGSGADNSQTLSAAIGVENSVTILAVVYALFSFSLDFDRAEGPWGQAVVSLLLKKEMVLGTEERIWAKQIGENH